MTGDTGEISISFDAVTLRMRVNPQATISASALEARCQDAGIVCFLG